MENSLPFVPTENADPARWITDGVQGFAESVLSIAPAGLEAYARIFHPAWQFNKDGIDRASTPVRWAEVARQTDRTPHRQMQWPHILGDGPPTHLNRPKEGSLPIEIARVLWPLLRPYTATPAACFFAVWEGFGCLGDTVRRAPAFETPSRRWHLFRAPIEAVEETFCTDTGKLLVLRRSGLTVAWQFVQNLLFGRRNPAYARLADADADADLDAIRNSIPLNYQSANLWWPEDRAWCVATEIDLETTYVGGSQAAVAAVVEHSALEAYRVEPTDGVTYSSDGVNSKPARPPADEPPREEQFL